MNRRVRICGWCAAFFLLSGQCVLYGQTYDAAAPTIQEAGPELIGGQGPVGEEPIQQVPEAQDLQPPRPSPSGGGPAVPSRSPSVSEDGSYRYERSVTNPQGEMTKTWERTATEDGYEWSREHRWTAPDGTVVREHQWSGSQTDPYNFQREKTMTLPGGRTMTHTQSRTWDGQTGTMEHTFQGPNGQYHQRQHSWTPDDAVTTLPVDPQTTPGDLTATEPPGEADVFATDLGQSSVETDQPETGFFGKLKAWGKRTFGGKNREAKSMRRSGFTVGSASRMPASARASHGAVPKQNPGQAVSSVKRAEHANPPAIHPSSGMRPGKAR